MVEAGVAVALGEAATCRGVATVAAAADADGDSRLTRSTAPCSVGELA